MIELIGSADQLNFEILQARRFEKNFLLYGSGLLAVTFMKQLNLLTIRAMFQFP